MKLADLKQSIPYRWKIQSFNSDKTKGSCVAYIDARDVMDLLDKVCGAENWQKRFYTVKNTLCCSVGIKIGDEWIWKDDGGVESATEKEKGECSDSFKRACVNWGIGRFLYDLDIKWIPVKPSGKSYRPVDENGEFIWDLTKHFNTHNTSPSPLKQTETGLVVKCSVCGETMVEKEGVNKEGKKWHGYFCPNSTKENNHPPRFI